ncbi:helix-turn-helix domain-containing protein [Nocardia sp. NPDC052566]|uniref:helix-turn-helix domain-containing protein n=1 Tax=Nocardia sp. NPDC052566 TaxID=3364330 RepID=UPI0037C98FAC
MAHAAAVGLTGAVTTAVQSNGFASQLKHWRTRRRVSQLDLAIRADTSQRYLSFLEQGRSKPGRTMVVRLAESLDLSLRERNNLLLAAGYAPVYPESDLAAMELGPVCEALNTILDGHLPYPAIVVRPHGKLVAANSAFDFFTEETAPELLVPPIDTLRLALHPRGLAPRVLNLPEWGRHITEALRARALRSPDPQLDTLIAELEGYLPDVTPCPDHLGFAVPLRLSHPEGELRLITTLTSFSTAVDVTLAELQLEAFLPADQQTADILRRRHERREAEAARS